jgi:hypothetical protein
MQAVAPVRAKTTPKLSSRRAVAVLATVLAFSALSPVPLAQARTLRALTTSVPAASLQKKCSKVTEWLIGVQVEPQSSGKFFVLFMKSGAGWVATLSIKPPEPIGVADVVIKGTTFYAHDTNSSDTETFGKSSTFSGKLAPDCTIGLSYYNIGSPVYHRMTPLGTWSGGTFTATPQDSPPATLESVTPDVGSSTGGSTITVTGWGFGAPGSTVQVDFCPVGVAAGPTTLDDQKCAEATNVLVRSEFLLTATTPFAPADILSKCNPQELCKAQVSVGRTASIDLIPTEVLSNVLTFTYRKGS